MNGLKLAVIGAGSTYTPEIVEGLIARRETLRVGTLCFMDVDAHKMGIVSGLVQRMLERAKFAGHFVQTTDLAQAVDGADYVIAQIRVGGLAARITDEKIPLKYGLLGQETTGIGGFMKALRTIGPIMDIAREMQRRCPDAWFINFSNPSGILAEAVLNHTNIKMLGLCNCPIGMLTNIKRELTGGSDFDYDYVGLNHLSWITSVRSNGKELLSRDALAPGGRMQNIPDIGFDDALLRAVGAIPSTYLGYFYNRDAHIKSCIEAELCRGEQCLEIERDLLNMYADPSLNEKPASLAKRGGALYSTAAVNLIDSIENDRRDRQVVNVKNMGALGFMDDDDVVEIQSVIGRDQVRPVPVPNFDNRHIIGLMRAVKQYEKLTVRAALTGDNDAALAALLTHPLVGDYEKAAPALREMLDANRRYLGQFYK